MNISMIKVSIIVPIYNTEKYLSRCLQSIDRQTIDSYEVILVNDGSTDASESVCRDFIKNKYQYRIINKQNGGLTSARYCGWQEARGEFVVFVDSDDYIEPNYCEALYTACVESDCDIAMCGYNLIANGGEPVRSYTFYDNNHVVTNVKDDYVKALISSLPKDAYNIPAFLWLRIMRRDLITPECFVSERKVFAEDLIFDLRFASRIDKIAVVKEPLYNYVINDGSLTRKYRRGLWGMYKDLYDCCNEYCAQEKINCNLRLKSLLIGGMLHSIHQACLLGYTSFSSDLSAIRKDQCAKSVMHSVGFLSKDFFALNINYRLAYCMIKFIPSYIVYRFYKWRQTR